MERSGMVNLLIVKILYIVWNLFGAGVVFAHPALRSRRLLKLIQETPKEDSSRANSR